MPNTDSDTSLLGRKIMVVGCPGSGKSTFARKLQDYNGIPLYHLDMFYHRPDKTITPSDEFDSKVEELCQKEEWILDGNYMRTIPLRIYYADTIFWLDYEQDVCVQSVLNRVGQKRDDMPWVEETIDPKFLQFVKDFHTNGNPILEVYFREAELLCKNTYRFKAREEADKFLENLQQQGDKHETD